MFTERSIAKTKAELLDPEAAIIPRSSEHTVADIISVNIFPYRTRPFLCKKNTENKAIISVLQ